MATAKQAQPSPSLAPVGVAVSIIVAAAATYFMLPGVLLLWVGILISAMIASPPQLTGPKDPVTQYPTPGNPGEKKKQQQFKFWQAVKSELWFPDMPWPITFAHVAALAAALVVVTLPTSLLHQNWAYPNAIAAYLLVSKIAVTRRRFAAEDSPKPATELMVFLGKAKDRAGMLHVIVASALGIAAFVMTLITSEVLDWYLLWPHLCFAAGVGVLVFALYGHLSVRAETVLSWEQTVEAQDAWKGRWAAMAKVKETPRLVSHQRVGENGEGWIDTFYAPASEGAQAWIPMPQGVEPTLPPNTIACFMSAPDLDGDGQPITVSRSAIRFKAITWRGDAVPDITDPNIDPDVLAAWLELCVTKMVLAYESTECALIPTGPPQALHTEDSTTAAWKVSYDLTSTSYEVPDTVSFAAKKTALMIDAEVYSFGDALYFGAVTDASTELQDDSIISELEAEAERERWKKTWSDMASALQAPRYFPELNADSEIMTTRSATPMTITRRLFVTPNGSSADVYFSKITTEQLRTALGAKPWAAMTHFVQAGKGRYAGGIAMYWSEEQVPRNPAEISPGAPRPMGARSMRGGPSSAAPRVSDAVQWAITGSINEGFISAKLTRPEVLSVQPLTGARSDTHIWTATMRLHGGVTAADVKKNAERIRQTIGCDWLRVTEHRDGCLIACGAVPSHPSVRFHDDRAEQTATSLDWEQAFLDSKVATAEGRVPELIGFDTLPKNSDVKVLTFLMPAGIDISIVRAGRGKIATSTNNAFIDIRHGSKAKEVVILVAAEDPMPNPAQFMWEEMGGTELSDARKVTFATNVEGEPVTWDLDLDSHLMILGSNGSGKGIAATSMLTDMLMSGWDVYAADPIKGFNDFSFADPWLRYRATTYPDTVAVVRQMIELLESRKALNAQHGVSNVKDLPEDVRPPMTAMYIDEFTSLVIPDNVPKLGDRPTEQESRDYAEAVATNDAKKSIGAAVGRILREGRATGLVMVVMGQKFTSKEAALVPGGSTMKSQMSRLAMGKMPFGDMMSAFNDAASAADLLGPSVPRGRGIFESTSAAAFAVQTWWAGGGQPEHFARMVEHIGELRDPLRDDERFDPTPFAPAVQSELDVFGAVIDQSSDTAIIVAEDEDEIVDLGEIELDLDFELEESDPEPASTYSAVPEPSFVAPVTDPGPDPAPYAGESPELPQMLDEQAAAAYPGAVPPPPPPSEPTFNVEEPDRAAPVPNPAVPPAGGLVFEAAKPKRPSKPTIEIQF